MPILTQEVKAIYKKKKTETELMRSATFCIIFIIFYRKRDEQRTNVRIA